MKNFIYFTALILLFSSCDNIQEKNLPIAARTFISTYFPDAQFSHGEKNKNDGIITLEINLSNGTELEFTELGEWVSVDCRYSFMPEGILSLIPQEIVLYFSATHPNSKIMKIEKEMGGYEINLNTPTGDFHFSSDGMFIRYEQ